MKAAHKEPGTDIMQTQINPMLQAWDGVTRARAAEIKVVQDDRFLDALRDLLRVRYGYRVKKLRILDLILEKIAVKLANSRFGESLWFQSRTKNTGKGLVGPVRKKEMNIDQGWFCKFQKKNYGEMNKLQKLVVNEMCPDVSIP